jgi:hypothetical protein
MDWVAGFTWIGWQPSHGLGGRHPWNMQTERELLFICHVRLKRSGAWWYEDSSNQMLALRCAKYNGTFEHVFRRPPHQKADA